MSDKKLRDKCRGAFLGLVVGDAMGAPVEFSRRGSFEPVTGYQAGGPFDLPAGYWTDDTSMAICLAESLIENDGLVDLEDQMRRYSNWYLHGHNSSTGKCFDIGNGTQLAIQHFLNGSWKRAPESSEGNGSLMRLAPLIIAHHLDDPENLADLCWLSSTTTHNWAASKLCQEFGLMLQDYLKGKQKKPDLRMFDIEKIENSGHAPKALEAAMFHFSSTDSFREAILQAVNYGDDSDTIGAITGQLAGAYYGESGIPPNWLSELHNYEYLSDLANKLISLQDTVRTKELQ